jgi:hypothetical protein
MATNPTMEPSGSSIDEKQHQTIAIENEDLESQPKGLVAKSQVPTAQTESPEEKKVVRRIDLFLVPVLT